ncbi:MAG: hypothetical protein PWP24_1678 [Clostridiales bacterium]|nr:hypothetical protein [Clostridiales bacterium]
MHKKTILTILTISLFFQAVMPAANALAKEATVVEQSNEFSTDSDEEDVDLSEKTITVTKENFVSDTFQGVDALYRPGKTDGTSATYSCAAYVKKFYKEVHDVSVYNLFGGSTPRTYEGSTFSTVKTPKAGDIAASSSHWAIVKSVDEDNKCVVLIEQNWKWQQGGQTVCMVNRSVSYDDVKFYRLNQ